MKEERQIYGQIMNYQLLFPVGFSSNASAPVAVGREGRRRDRVGPVEARLADSVPCP